MQNYEIFFLEDFTTSDTELEPEYQIFFPSNDSECNRPEIIHVQPQKTSIIPGSFIDEHLPLLDEIVAVAFGFFSFLIASNTSDIGKTGEFVQFL
jgi:hypothetical protein